MTSESAAPGLRDTFSHPSELLGLSRRELARVLCTGHAIDAGALAGREYEGLSLGLPAFVDRLTWKKFKKVFHRDESSGAVVGWNVRLEQNALGEPCVPLERRGSPITFGHYSVQPLAGYRCPLPCGSGVMLDYGMGTNAALDPLRLLRDPLVALVAGSTRLLLGWSYLDLGLARIGTPSFFALWLDERASAPAPAR